MFINTVSCCITGPNLFCFFINLWIPISFQGRIFALCHSLILNFISFFTHISVMAGSIRTIVNKFTPKDKSSLIAILQAAQKQEGYLSPVAVDIISKHLGISKSQVYSVATFYRSFSFTPKGECCISVCVGTACHVRGAQIIAEELERVFGIKAGGTTQDLKFSLETVSCLGACAL